MYFVFRANNKNCFYFLENDLGTGMFSCRYVDKLKRKREGLKSYLNQCIPQNEKCFLCVMKPVGKIKRILKINLF